jgi:hypothetical protein
MHTTSLPTGTVTFLFTDIEGSVNLWEEHPAAMRAALARHDDLLRHAIESHGGHVFKTVGDAFYAAFTTAPDAIVAALDAQRSLHAEIWNETGPVRVRMALHTGTAEVRGGDYFGPHLNRVARLLDAGHGGQVLLSLATEELARDQLLEVAADLLEEFEDGVFFVNLAPITDSSLVPSTIAQPLGIQDAGDQPLTETLRDTLRHKQLLLLLDNVEQVLPAAPLVAELLASCPRLKALATSRAALHLRGEKARGEPAQAVATGGHPV